MTFQAGLHRYIKIVLSNSDGIIISTRRKLQGVHETVIHFVKIFKVNILWSVTGVTCGNFAVRRLVPTVILITHDMAIYTGLRVIQ